jgi:hypothetical protein
MSTSATDLIAESFEVIEHDLNSDVFARYFELSPASGTLMRYTDEYMRGRMLEQVYQLMLGEADFEAWLDFELGNHREYGVTDDMYSHLFAALHQVTREHAGAQWRAEWEQAWHTRVDELLAFIGEHLRPPRSAAG